MSVVGAKPFQIVVWGATGFTGKLVCEHLARHYKGQVKWALAGRDASKLEVVRKDLAKYDSDINQIPIITAQLSDEYSLDELTKSSEVVISTVGPYAKYGTPLVKSAIKSKTHLLDLTGELNWVKNLINEFHEEAVQKNVKVVNCSGFEVVPTDLAAYLIADYAQKNHGVKCEEIFVNLQDSFGGVSGGTAQSAIGIRDSLKGPQAMKYNSVFCLTPENSKRNDDYEYNSFKYEPNIKSWVVGSPFQFLSARTFRRSNYLLNYKYGTDVIFREYINAGNQVVAIIIDRILKSGGNLLKEDWFFNILKLILPKAGQGPPRQVMMNGFWKYGIYGVFKEKGSGQKKLIEGVAQGFHDPGYYDTTRLLLETALTLTLNKKDIDNLELPKGGILTPASACGLPLIERLNKANIPIFIKSTKNLD